MGNEQVPQKTRSLPYVGRLEALDPTDFVQTRMTIPASLIARLHNTKRRHGLRTRDAVIGSMLRIARTQFRLADFRLPPEPPASDIMQPIIAEVEAGQLAFLYRLQRQFRGAALGAAFEAVAAVVTDIEPPVQLELVGLSNPTQAAAIAPSSRQCGIAPSPVPSHEVLAGFPS